MSFDNAILHGKEHRKPYRKSQRFDASCRNHGGCGYCRGNRQHANAKRARAAREAVREFETLATVIGYPPSYRRRRKKRRPTPKG
jgi:hypothetical protein